MHIWLLLILLFASPCHASLDFSLYGGNVQTSTSNDEVVPKVSEFGSMVSMKYPLTGWFSLGIGGEYEILNQYTDPTPATGNHGGRIYGGTLATELAAGWGVLKLDAMVVGSYEMPNTIYQGQKVVYGSFRGGRVALLFPITNFWLGAYYQNLEFNSANFPNAEIMKVTSAGLVLEIRFFDNFLYRRF